VVKEAGPITRKRIFWGKTRYERALMSREITAERGIKLSKGTVAFVCVYGGSFFCFYNTVIYDVSAPEFITNICPPADIHIASKRQAFPRLISEPYFLGKDGGWASRGTRSPLDMMAVHLTVAQLVVKS